VLPAFWGTIRHIQALIFASNYGTNLNQKKRMVNDIVKKFLKFLFRENLSIIYCTFLALAVTGCQAIARITPTPTKTPQPPTTATATSTPTGTPIPTGTATSTPVPTPTADPTDTPTMNPTDTPVPAPTDTPLPANTSPPAPTPTPVDIPTDTPVPAPSVDFKVITQRMFSMKENGGDPQEGGCGMNHTMYIKVIDINGNAVDVTLNVAWPGGEQDIETGGKGPGKAEWPMYGSYWLKVLRDLSSGREYTSEVTREMSSFHPALDDLVAGGYCLDRSIEECSELRNVGIGHLCYGHYSYEVVFQRQW
jgi:hypothetical protein